MRKILLAGFFCFVAFVSLAEQWKVHEKKDEMRGTSTYMAELRSTNNIELSSPQNGNSQLVVMMVSLDEKNILGTALMLSNCRLACQSAEKCIISAKFGDGPVK